MPNLFSRTYTPNELHEFAGDLAQIAGIRRVVIDDGKARGLRAAEVWTGTGFRFWVYLDRALDIGAAEHGGRALAWLHPALGTAAEFDPHGAGWVRTFGGGLVTTCGLTHFGQPETDGDEELGLHGRISHTPAEQIRVSTDWIGDEYVLEIEGRARQGVLFGENLVLTRRITCRLGGNSFTIRDRVVNEGFRESPHMILYHCNFGFPAVSPDSQVLLNEESVRPRDARAEKGLGNERSFERPQRDYPEQVFFHKPHADAAGFASAAIVNRALNFGAFLRWRAAELPYLGQWKLMQAGEYVCALEPANYWETPRKKLRAEGRLRMLKPGEVVEYELELGALPDAESIKQFEQTSGAN